MHRQTPGHENEPGTEPWTHTIPHLQEIDVGIPGAYVGLPAEGADGNGVVIKNGEVVTEAPVDVSDPAVADGQPPTEPRDKCWTEDGLVVGGVRSGKC